MKLIFKAYLSHLTQKYDSKNLQEIFWRIWILNEILVMMSFESLLENIFALNKKNIIFIIWKVPMGMTKTRSVLWHWFSRVSPSDLWLRPSCEFLCLLQTERSPEGSEGPGWILKKAKYSDLYWLGSYRRLKYYCVG